MTNNVSIKDIQAQKNNLQIEFEQAQKAMQDAQALYAEKKATLITFNDKYGRVLQMMKEK